MKIKSLTLKNFKSIKSLTISANSQNINIYGDNATGKTTVFDAFTWLLFDKDSLNRKDFGIKPLENGEVVHGIESEVECEFDNGITLKKVFQEKWVKTRGKATAEFSGHTTDYFVNGVPVKKGEYEDKIKALADEKAFKLLTNPLHFNEQLHWQDRRKMLFEVCGDISDQEVIENNKSLSKLTSMLGGNSIEDFKKIVASRRAKINKELEEIPHRIDEVKRGIPELSCNNPDALKDDIFHLQELKAHKQQSIVRIQSGGEIAQKEKELAELKTELLKIKNDYEEKKQAAQGELRKKRNGLSYQSDNLGRERFSRENRVKSLNESITELERIRERLKSDWYLKDEMKFTCDDKCPTCGQYLPDEMIDEAKAKFNLEKSKNLEEISAQGKQAVSDITKLNDEIAVLEAEIKQLYSDQEQVQRELDELKIPDIAPVEVSLEYKAKNMAIASLKDSISLLKEGNQDEIRDLQGEIRVIDDDITALQSELAKVEQINKAHARIEELKGDERRLAKEFEDIESQIYMTEEFTKTKVRLITDNINSKFKLARFKLFDTQINGGLQDCCEVMVNGVPYTDLNNAMKINVGLDIINTLSECFVFDAPIFVDNAESVTQLFDTKTQVVRLIVSEQDKTLRVEGS